MSQILSNICIARRYKLIKQIGEGSFGKIYMAKSLENNTHVAVKLVFLSNKIGKMQ